MIHILQTDEISNVSGGGGFFFMRYNSKNELEFGDFYQDWNSTAKAVIQCCHDNTNIYLINGKKCKCKDTTFGVVHRKSGETYLGGPGGASDFAKSHDDGNIL